MYCGKEGIPLEVGHVVPKSLGGSDRVSNLVLACHACNQAKNGQLVEEFLEGEPTLLEKIKKGLNAPVRDAAAMNTARYAVVAELLAMGFTVSTGTGALTKRNKISLGLPKEH